MHRRPDTTPPGSHRQLLAARQQALIDRSSQLRGELAAELAEGWQQLETPVGWWLRLKSAAAAVTQGVRDQTQQRPWLGLLLPMVALPAWRWLRRLGRADAAAAHTQRAARTARVFLPRRLWRGALRVITLYGTWRSVQPVLAPVLGPLLAAVLPPRLDALLRRWRRR